MDESQDSLDQMISNIQLVDYNFNDKSTFDYVYRPNDDTYLMFEAIKADIYHLMDIDPLFVLEIGYLISSDGFRSGSGAVITTVSKLFNELQHYSAQYFAVDINYDAIVATQQLANKYDCAINALNANILNNVTSSTMFDVIICNPPYVPTDNQELNNAIKQIKVKNQLILDGKYEEAKQINCIDISYAGGENGLHITQKMIDQSLSHLSQTGVFYLLLIQDNRLKQIMVDVIQKGFQYEVLKKRKFHNEIIFIFKISHQS